MWCDAELEYDVLEGFPFSFNKLYDTPSFYCNIHQKIERGAWDVSHWLFVLCVTFSFVFLCKDEEEIDFKFSLMNISCHILLLDARKVGFQKSTSPHPLLLHDRVCCNITNALSKTKNNKTGNEQDYYLNGIFKKGHSFMDIFPK